MAGRWKNGLKDALYGFEGAEHFQKGTRTEARPGGIAQLVEHLLCKQGVIGSNPFTSTSFRLGTGESGRKE